MKIEFNNTAPFDMTKAKDAYGTIIRPGDMVIVSGLSGMSKALFLGTREGLFGEPELVFGSNFSHVSANLDPANNYSTFECSAERMVAAKWKDDSNMKFMDLLMFLEPIVDDIDDFLRSDKRGA